MDSFYFTIITLSTVGYGDIIPQTWLAKLFVLIMILVSITLLPRKIERFVSLWLEKNKMGEPYNNHHSLHKHIVVCITKLEYEFLQHFLKEFYAHNRNQTTHTVVLTTTELNSSLKHLFTTSTWHGRLYYVNGSAIRNADLKRTSIRTAKCVFILSPRGAVNRDIEDQHTIIRSWAIKDYAPNVPQFVQLFRTENKVHLDFVENIVSEDEFKYAILANNCLCPGISTLITLLMHKSTPTFKSKPGNLEEWQKIYGKLAGNEIHSIPIEQSRIFKQHIGKTFSQASYEVHEKHNFCLIGVSTRKKQYKNSIFFSQQTLNEDYETKFEIENETTRTIVINPGNDYCLQSDDICFYVSLIKEERYDWKSYRPKVNQISNDILIHGPELSSRRMILRGKKSHTIDILDRQTTELHDEQFFSIELREDESHTGDVSDLELVISKPPNPLYLGCFSTTCKINKILTDVCCLELDGTCEHRHNTTQVYYKWKNKSIILASEEATNGLFNFIVPLRVKVRSTAHLKPIILLLRNRPSHEFLESVSCFPLVYWMQGTISSINTLLKAGIFYCDALVIVSNDNQNSLLEEEPLYDSSNLFSIQNIYRLFPQTKIIAELSRESNIRFLKFRANDATKDCSRCKMSYMYRHPFAAGNVFSASMIDTLLYQAYGKPFLIELFRLMIGLSQTDGSGHLTSIPLRQDDMWLETYGNLYKKLASSTGEIPIGIFRTTQIEVEQENIFLQRDIKRLIQSKMRKLGINSNENQSRVANNYDKLCFVLINPPSDFLLHDNDIIYLLKPGNLSKF